MFGSSRRVARRTARRTSRRQAAFRDPQEGYYDEPEPTPQYAPAPTEPDYATELEKLAKLRDEQVISEDEFQAKKKQILGI